MIYEYFSNRNLYKRHKYASLNRAQSRKLGHCPKLTKIRASKLRALGYLKCHHPLLKSFCNKINSYYYFMRWCKVQKSEALIKIRVCQKDQILNVFGPTTCSMRWLHVMLNYPYTFIKKIVYPKNIWIYQFSGTDR